VVFVPGLRLSRAFYSEAVRPLLDDLPHSAARIGSGSEVLGFDTPRSADHEWGPRLELFLAPADAGHIPELDRRLAERLPRTFHGWPTHFETVEGDHVGRMTPASGGPVHHRVGITTVEAWCAERLGVDPRAGMRPTDWLAVPWQALAEATGGAVFHDGLGELDPLRAALAWYPPDVWRYVLACQWRRIAQEEAFVGRTGEVGDELGSAVVAARLVRDLMRLALLLHRRYPPYGKWLGSAFAALPPAADLDPVLRGALAATATRPYFDRPFQVLKADRFADALVAAVTDPVIAALPRTGAIDQHADNTDLLTDPHRTRRVAEAALSAPRAGRPPADSTRG
jgi:hypothetical protein